MKTQIKQESTPEKEWQKNFFKVKRKKSSEGIEYDIVNSNENTIGYTLKKKYTLKVSLTIYSDKIMVDDIFKVVQKKENKTHKFFELCDLKDEKIIGYLERKKPKPHKKDEWILLDNEKNKIGKIIENSLLKALLRRHIIKRIPFEFDIIKDDVKIGHLRENISLTSREFHIKIKDDFKSKIDRRFFISIVLCLDVLWF